MAKGWNGKKMSHKGKANRPPKPQRIARTPSETKKRKESKQ